MSYESWMGKTWLIDWMDGSMGLSGSLEMRFVEGEGGEKKVEIPIGTCWATACVYANTTNPDTLQGINCAGKPFTISRTIEVCGERLSCVVEEGVVTESIGAEDPGGSWTAHDGNSGPAGP